MRAKSLSCVSISDSDLIDLFRPFALKMEEQVLPPIIINLFKCYFSQLVYNNQGKLSKKEILPVDQSELRRLEDLASFAPVGQKAIPKLVYFKLNGGLGTSMGLEKAKSLIKIKEDKTFLDLILEQTTKLRQKYNCPLPLVLMNSFKTHLDTMLHVQDFENPDHIPLAFVQHKFPKVMVNDLSPAKWPQNPELEWNPPGHGDFYTALITSGILKTLLDKGYKYGFISNSDNLGATIDKRILGYLVKKNLTFLMEVTPRTKSDRKGGHLCRLLKNNRLALREIAQCPDNELNEFMDYNKYNFFNTNSIWLNLEALEKVFLRHKMMPLDLIINPKHLDPRVPSSPKVYQLETAMGSAISAFDRAEALIVPRERFAPVKTTNDLLLVQSDCFITSDESTIIPNPSLKNHQPQVNLDENFYKKIDDYEERFPYGSPKLSECLLFEVQGDIKFGANIVVKGETSLVNEKQKQVAIPDNTELKGEIKF
ncbi:UTP--glucose-1-phosphate uridylyltransferase [Desulfohalobiaceae bacterium Ax17]|uniref:UTP--glucose-1-phosphate uridylyltransferase n=1 Tax=Desulfovulcanus ferrireducens TaxID=2831190 RepID=UPI00207B9CEB|nr:UTP--glucose-1-phosphate uridylyltransferase [Desulfovulcanus ferrireducens]MBT8762320.1 UTP--glucose-1-phosphate uridylyltransferase [Desulfovulcanus ferrireducens]